MTLWHLVAATELPHEVLHVNFGLRAAASDADEELVRTTAGAREVRLHVERAMIPLKATGLQSIARDIRREHTARLLADRSAVLLAHHANDQAETVLMKLSRGTGGRGLAGMRPVAGAYLRPLLNATKEELTAFAKTHAIAYREDASNATDDYQRNRFRHHVLPVLTQVEPRAVAGICLSAKRQAELLVFAEAQAQKVLAKAAIPPSSTDQFQVYNRDELRATPGLGFVLQHWLGPLGFRSALVDDVSTWIGDGEPHQRLCDNSNHTARCVVTGGVVRLHSLETPPLLHI